MGRSIVELAAAINRGSYESLPSSYSPTLAESVKSMLQSEARRPTTDEFCRWLQDRLTRPVPNVNRPPINSGAPSQSWRSIPTAKPDHALTHDGSMTPLRSPAHVSSAAVAQRRNYLPSPLPSQSWPPEPEPEPEREPELGQS